MTRTEQHFLRESKERGIDKNFKEQWKFLDITDTCTYPNTGSITQSVGKAIVEMSKDRKNKAWYMFNKCQDIHSLITKH